MTAKKLDYPLEFFVGLRRIGKKAVVVATFAVSRFDGFLVRSQGRLEFTRQANPCVLSEAICSAMHDQDGHVELRGAIPGSERVARRMKTSGLRVPTRR